MMIPQPDFKVTHVPLLQKGKTYILVYQKHLIKWWFLSFHLYLITQKFTIKGIFNLEDHRFNNYDQVKQYITAEILK